MDSSSKEYIKTINFFICADKKDIQVWLMDTVGIYKCVVETNLKRYIFKTKDPNHCNKTLDFFIFNEKFEEMPTDNFTGLELVKIFDPQDIKQHERFLRFYEHDGKLAHWNSTYIKLEPLNGIFYIMMNYYDQGELHDIEYSVESID